MYRLAIAYVDTGDTVTALSWLDRAIAEASPQSPQPWWLADAMSVRSYLQ